MVGGKKTDSDTPVRVLFVCTGNICRSPTAEGVFRAMAAACGLDHAVAADSAGMIAYHTGEPPDERAQAAAAARGIDIGGQRARQISPSDFETFDFIIAMDRSHHRDLLAIAPASSEDRIRLFLDFAPQAGMKDVPDPYYGGLGGFDLVLDLIEAGAAGLLQEVRTRLPRER